jgi:hypothetical protein
MSDVKLEADGVRGPVEDFAARRDPQVRRITRQDVADAFAAGIRDFQAQPMIGLFFGGIYALGGLGMVMAAASWGMLYLVYPLAAGTAARAWLRGLLGAAGALVATTVLGLMGLGSTLVPLGAIDGLTAAVTGADDLITTPAAVAVAVGPGPLLLAAVWAVMAITAPAVLHATGRPLAVATGLWLGLGTLVTLAIGVALTGALHDPVPIVVGAGAGGIVIFVRSRRPRGASDTAQSSMGTSTRG